MPFDILANQDAITKTVAGLTEKGIETTLVQNEAEALQKIKDLIPKGASVMNGASVSLEQIGFVDYLKSGDHGWKNLHEAIVQEQDPAKQAELRKQSVLSDFYLGSVHALLENGEFVIASNTGSQLPQVVFTSPNLIFVVGVQKIVPNLAEAFKRLEEYVVPLEDKHMQEKYGMGTQVNKVLIFKHENPNMGRKVRIILVNKQLGF